MKKIIEYYQEIPQSHTAEQTTESSQRNHLIKLTHYDETTAKVSNSSDPDQDRHFVGPVPFSGFQDIKS